MTYRFRSRATDVQTLPNGLRIMTKPIKNVYKLESDPRFSLKSQLLPERGSQKLLKAATIAHTAKIVARILRGRIERKIDGVA